MTSEAHEKYHPSDGFDHPRMAEYLKPEDLNTDACVALASQILQDAAKDYIHARRALDHAPGHGPAVDHYRRCRRFYLSDWFTALSGGLADGEAVMRELDRMARGGNT